MWKANMLGIWFIIAAFGASFGQIPSTACDRKGTTAIITGNITCEHSLQVFVDGTPVGHQNATEGFQTVVRYVIPVGSQVIALKCQGKAKSSGISGGILGSFDNGLVTDEKWKCSNALQEGWNTINFDATLWSFAVVHGTNNFSSPSMSWPWGLINDVTDGARWVWTADNKQNDSTVYCRHKFVMHVTQCPQVTSSGYFTSDDTFFDRSLKGGVVVTTVTASSTECALRCLQVPQCKSFNFQYAAKTRAKACELNKHVADTSQESLIERKGFMYFNILQL